MLVSLVQEDELRKLGIVDLHSQAQYRGIRIMCLPIEDGGVPGDSARAIRLVRGVIAALDAGETVVVHCRGGLGRSGLIAACYLVATGEEYKAAIARVRAARPGAVENDDQEQFVAAFASEWRRAPPVVPSVSRFTGCLLGGALGDALGYPVEFLRTAPEIAAVLGDGPPVQLPRAQGRKALVSDDTQMTLFTAEGFIRAQHRWMDRGICSPPSVILRAYQRWLSTQTSSGPPALHGPSDRGWLVDVPELRARRAPGTTCVTALQASLTMSTLPSVETRLNDSKGCGAVMRVAPIGLAAADPEVAFRLGRDSGALTHGHPSGFLSAAYFSVLIHQVARDVALVDAMDVADVLLHAEPDASEVVAAVETARQAAAEGRVSRDVIERLGGGWVGEEALAIALLCALTTSGASPSSVAHSLWVAVAHGGDSDSTGSLMGNLLGATYGLEALPRPWLEDLEMREVIERVARDLHTTCVLGFEAAPGRYPAT